MRKVAYSEEVRIAAARITTDHEHRRFITRNAPRMGGNTRDVLIRAYEASGIKDESLERALRCPKAEDIIRKIDRIQ